MYIALDASPLEGGHSNRGVGGYTKNLIEALLKHKTSHTFHVFDSRKQIPPVTDVIHYPYFDPFFLTLPISPPTPSVVTVHDLIPIIYPDHFPKGLRGLIKWEIQKYSLQRKQRIITDSECSKKDIYNLTGFDKEKIDVVYLAPSLPKTVPSKKFEALNKQYGIKDTYFLFVGDVNWNKNIPGLLHAFAQFIKTPLKTRNPASPAGRREPVTLILVGRAFLDATLPETREINTMISSFGIGDRIIMTGYVDDEILVLLYGQAQALIQPSLYEGFGFPVLEAMSLGCPVVCSSSSSLPEIAGPSVMVDPKDSVSIRMGMEHIRSLTQEQRKQLIEKGREWAHTFSWQKVARETIRSYEKVLGNK